MPKNFERTTDAVLGLTCIVVLSLLLRREFSQPKSVTVSTEPTEFIENWHDLLPSGIRDGSPTAKLVVVEFGDLECPACKVFNESFANLRKKYGQEVALVFVHYPLSIHRFAPLAARALECAHEQGRGGSMITAVYGKQDSSGLKSWDGFANEAGVPNATELQSCVASSRVFPRIRSGIEFGNRLGVRGTPTILINGWRVRPGNTFAQAMDAVRDGRAPYEKFNRRSF